MEWAFVSPTEVDRQDAHQRGQISLTAVFLFLCLLISFHSMVLRHEIWTQYFLKPSSFFHDSLQKLRDDERSKYAIPAFVSNHLHIVWQISPHSRV